MPNIVVYWFGLKCIAFNLYWEIISIVCVVGCISSSSWLPVLLMKWPLLLQHTSKKNCFSVYWGVPRIMQVYVRYQWPGVQTTFKHYCKGLNCKTDVVSVSFVIQLALFWSVVLLPWTRVPPVICTRLCSAAAVSHFWPNCSGVRACCFIVNDIGEAVIITGVQWFGDWIRPNNLYYYYYYLTGWHCKAARESIDTISVRTPQALSTNP